MLLPVIMAGGTGSRLWPMSRELYPKQFLRLFGQNSMLQETITRLKLAAQPPDLLVTIPRNVCTFYDFHLAKSVIELGRKRTREALARWAPPNGSGR